jgi:hypothetical protein
MLMALHSSPQWTAHIPELKIVFGQKCSLISQKRSKKPAKEDRKNKD